MNTPEKILVICRSSPYASSRAREAIDTVLTGAAYEQHIQVLFMGDGVFQLLPHQNGNAIQQKTLSSLIAALAMYDINDIFVEDSALQRRQISHDQLQVSVTPLDNKDLGQFIANHDCILSF